MSWATIGALPGEETSAVATGETVQVTIGAIPHEVRLMLHRELAERLHTALGEHLDEVA